MSNKAMSEIAAQVPTTMEELTDLGVLGENVVAEYGQRLVKNISFFVKEEKLEKYIERRQKSSKRAKVSPVGGAAEATASKGKDKENSLNVPDDFDDAGIDFAAIDLPDGRPSGDEKPTAKKSLYF